MNGNYPPIQPKHVPRSCGIRAWRSQPLAGIQSLRPLTYLPRCLLSSGRSARFRYFGAAEYTVHQQTPEYLAASLVCAESGSTCVSRTSRAVRLLSPETDVAKLNSSLSYDQQHPLLRKPARLLTTLGKTAQPINTPKVVSRTCHPNLLTEPRIRGRRSRLLVLGITGVAHRDSLIIQTTPAFLIG